MKAKRMLLVFCVAIIMITMIMSCKVKPFTYIEPYYPYQVSSPTFSPAGGTYIGDQIVSIRCAEMGAIIVYTTDGTTPNSDSPVYSSPITVTNGTTIKARARLEGWVESETGSATYKIGEMKLVEGGTFSRQDSDGSYPIFPVMVTLSSFYIDQFEVTLSSYEAIVGTNPVYFPDNPNSPAVFVSWFDAIAYCNYRSTQEGLTPCYSYSTYGTNPSDWPAGWDSNDFSSYQVNTNWNASGYRLPTEMEWMYAAKGGNQSQGYTYSGSNYLYEVAWCDSNSSNTRHDVGTKQPNELGIFDMSGNVFEWCWDIKGEYPGGAQDNPTGPTQGTFNAGRVNRGGAYHFDTKYCSVAYRHVGVASGGYYHVGFRCVRRAL